jgi:hypothetical protein
VNNGSKGRRRVLALGLGGIAGLATQDLIGGSKTMAQGLPQTVVYASNAGSKDIFVLAMKRATGALELIEKTPVPGTDKPSSQSVPMATTRSTQRVVNCVRPAATRWERNRIGSKSWI